MGLDFVRKAAKSFKKGLDNSRVELGTPTLFTREPDSKPRAYVARTLREVELVPVAKEVYSVLGEGNLESVYERAMAIEFRQRGIPYAVENNVEVLYKGEYVGMDPKLALKRLHSLATPGAATATIWLSVVRGGSPLTVARR